MAINLAPKFENLSYRLYYAHVMFEYLFIDVCKTNSSYDGNSFVCGAGVRVAEPPQDGHQGRGRGDDIPPHLLHGGQL